MFDVTQNNLFLMFKVTYNNHILSVCTRETKQLFIISQLMQNRYKTYIISKNPEIDSTPGSVHNLIFQLSLNRG